jgi:hypothetical protein
LRLILFILSLYFFDPKLAHADLDFEDSAYPELITSARALALGNAYICKVDDAWAAFYNPAGLGTVRKPSLHLGNIHLEGSNTYLKAVGGGPATDIPGNVADSMDAQEMREMLVEQKGGISHARLNFFPNFTVRGMTMGYMVSQRNRALIDEPAGSPYEIGERRDHGPVFALNASFFGGVFKIGASAVYLFRRELDMSIAETAPVNITDNDYKSGKGLILTAGTRLTLPWTFLPTLAVVVRNAADQKFDTPGDSGVLPDQIKQTVDAGFSITPQIGKVTRVHMEINLRDLNNEYDTDVKRRSSLGLELDFNRRIFMRVGSGDGWGSGGIGVRSRTFIFDLSTYAIDRSLDGFREHEDRRWVLSLSSGI